MEAPCFVTDIFLPQMLYALTIRSPIARGRLKSIECPQLPGSYTLISAQDIPGKNFLEDSRLPILAGDEVSYIGEPVAILLGPDKNTLEEYSRLCKVIAEEDTPFFSPGESDADKITVRRNITVGDPETAFAQAACIIHDSYASGIQEHWYAEPIGAVAWPDEEVNTKNGALIVQTATQWPFHVRRSVSQVLGLAAFRVLVRPTITGPHMDGKLWYPSLISCHAALGAWITKRPVRLILTREEDFLFSPKRCGTEINIASALDEEGTVTGVKVNTAVNLGAYEVNAAEILDHVNLGSLGVYKTSNIQLSGVAYRTNIPPQGPCAGFGLAQGFFAMERHVSHIADTLKKDPAQWRQEHGIQGGILPLGIPVKDAVPMAQLVDTAVKMSDYGRKWASYELLRQSRKEKYGTEQSAGQGSDRKSSGETLRGIGIALGYQGNGLLYSGLDKGCYSIELILEKDGSLEIKASMAGTSASNAYDGCGGAWANIASRILGLDTGMVRINYSMSVDSGPSTMSRNITVLSRLVEQACLAISKKRFRDPLPISVRKTIHPQKNSLWDELFPLSPDCNGFVRPGWASAIVEVEINPLEHLPRIRGIWMGVDGGKIIAENSARKSLIASTVQALGWAYREQINYINGEIPAEQFDDFDIPGPVEIPPINIEFIKSNQAEPKGIGDLPFTCIPAAYVQAVSQAMNYHFQSIPVKVLDLWYAGVKKITAEEALV